MEEWIEVVGHPPIRVAVDDEGQIDLTVHDGNPAHQATVALTPIEATKLMLALARARDATGGIT